MSTHKVCCNVEIRKNNTFWLKNNQTPTLCRAMNTVLSVQLAEWLVFLTTTHEVLGSSSWRQLMTVWHFIAQSLSLSSFHPLDI